MFDDFEKDTVTLFKKDGDSIENIKASVQTSMILVSDTSVPIETGDKLSRKLPSGIEEVFLVTDPGYSSGVGSIEPHYQIKYKRNDALPENSDNLNTTIYNVSGQNSRVNINSNDHSSNQIYNAPEKIFDDIRSVIKKDVSDEVDRNILIDLIGKMEESQGTGSYLDNYKEFIAIASNHVSIIAPFFPALAGLLI